MVTIDCHIHVTEIPEHAPEWWVTEMYAPWGGEAESVDGQAVVDALDEVGIDVGLIQGGDIRRTTYHPDHPDDHKVLIPNDWVAGEVAKHPGRLYGVAAMDPLRDIPAAVSELERCVKELDFRMLKLVPTYHHYSPRDRRIDPIYEKCLELDIPVMIHMGWTATINAPMEFQNPVLLDEVGRRYRDLKVIVAHLGYPWVGEGIAVVAKHPNFYAEMAGWIAWGPKVLADALVKLKELGAIDRVVYGSDNMDATGLYREARELAAAEGVEITDAEMAAIMGGTAAQLCNIPE
jgi:predicted TIM-barrel fold metal-dependent hydrolase